MTPTGGAQPPRLFLRLAVSGDLDVETSDDLRDELIDLAQASHVSLLELDLSAVKHIDGAGLSALHDAFTALESRGRRLYLSEVSPAITRAIYGAGLHHALHKGDVIPIRRRS